MAECKKFCLISACAALAAVSILSVIYIYFFQDNNLEFEYVDCIKVSSQELQKETFGWISLLDEDFEPFWDEQYLKNMYGMKDDYFSSFDKDEHTYVVTFGRKLSRLHYRFSEARTKYFGIVPKQYIARVVLSEKTENYLYIYRTKRINIVNDYYGNAANYIEYENQSGH